MYLKTILLLFCLTIRNAVGTVRCYACTFSSVDSDQSCLTITNTTFSVDCPYTYCTIMRQEYLDPPGSVASFTRGCDDEPDYLNHEITDTTFRTFYRACTSDLCNIGNGIQSVVGGGLSPVPEYTGDNLLVPGTGNAGVLQPTLLTMFLSSAAVYNVVN
ncbi:hypothetical protein ACJJTC_004060 [Scirpophaga incertulas]